jgi:predicted amidophosphoribosyltransferase
VRGQARAPEPCTVAVSDMPAMRKACSLCGRTFAPTRPEYAHCWACYERLRHADDWPQCKECQRYYERGFMAGFQLGRSLAPAAKSTG